MISTARPSTGIRQRPVDRRRVAMGTLVNPPSPTHWRSLRYFSVYRLIIGGMLLASVRLQRFGVESMAPLGGTMFEHVAWVYLGLAFLSLVAVWRWPFRFNAQLGVQVCVDVAVFVMLLHAAGGMRSGIGLLLLVSLAGAGLVGQGRLVLSFAALATLALLGQQVYQALATEFDGAVFVQAGAMSMAFFAVAILARLLARRVLASEALARQRGEDLQRQFRVMSRVIAMLDDGILVVSSDGLVNQANPRAREFLGIGEEKQRLESMHRVLHEAYAAWRSSAGSDEVEIRAGAQRTQLTARFIDVADAAGDALVFLQDVGEQREIAQRQKLAALGRLTGGIAHEIRNPLSSIRYAAELLKEDNRSVTDRRMLDIVLDNAQRLERIVRDVLELGRRDRASPQLVQIESFLSAFVAEFSAASGWPPGMLVLDPVVPDAVRIDPSHLRQILWNLVGNAGRHSSGRDGSVRLSATPSPFLITVDDDGPGVPAELIPRLFEPFFTTDPHGNGLGLYIARELCEANGCRLHYETGPSGGARFVITGESSWGS